MATDNFNSKNILGQGGFGVVYRGSLRNGTVVAVKRLKNPDITGEVQFQTEVEMIGLAMHRNLLRLYGFCMTSNERLLVYPFMPNGSVADRLRGIRSETVVSRTVVVCQLVLEMAVVRKVSHFMGLCSVFIVFWHIKYQKGGSSTTVLACTNWHTSWYGINTGLGIGDSLFWRTHQGLQIHEMYWTIFSGKRKILYKFKSIRFRPSTRKILVSIPLY